MGKIPLEIDSDNVADVLEIKPHATLKEKEKENYATGVKPGQFLKLFISSNLF